MGAAVGVVVDSAFGSAIAGAHVLVTLETGATDGQPVLHRQAYGDVVTDENGGFVLEALRPGVQTIVVTHVLYATGRRVLHVAEGSIDTLRMPLRSLSGLRPGDNRE